MSAMLENARASLVLHRLAIWKCFFFVAGTLGGSMLAALSGMDWAASDTQTKIMVMIGIVVSFSSTMGAFIDQSLKAVRDGKDPITGVSLPPFAIATQRQVDEGKSQSTIVTPKTLEKKLEDNLPSPAQ